VSIDAARQTVLFSMMTQICNCIMYPATLSVVIDLRVGDQYTSQVSFAQILERDTFGDRRSAGTEDIVSLVPRQNDTAGRYHTIY
jgi:hypothetical protein